MSVGNQANAGNVNNTLTSLALAMREHASDVLEFWAWANKEGLAGLEAIGFSAADAQAVLDNVNHMATPMQVYKGTVQAGGSGGVGAVAFDYEDYLTPLWAGQ